MTNPLHDDTRLGLELLAVPEGLAEDLVAEIQRVVAEQEQKDSKRLQQWSRKARRTSHLRPLQVLGVILGLVGVTLVIVGLAVGVAMTASILGLAAFGLGIVLHRTGRYRERLALPVPDFALL